jgi:hypothetical protein
MTHFICLYDIKGTHAHIVFLPNVQALQNFFSALVTSANTSFDSLLESLLACAESSTQSGGIAKQALQSISQSVAVLCLAVDDQKCTSTVRMLTDILKDDSSLNSVSYPPVPVLCSDLFLNNPSTPIQAQHAPIQFDLKA